MKRSTNKLGEQIGSATVLDVSGVGFEGVQGVVFRGTMEYKVEKCR